jgi:hypothetical protein
VSETQYLTIPEAAKAVKPFPVNPKHIRRAIHRGTLRAIKRSLGNKPVYFINPEDLKKSFIMLNH